MASKGDTACISCVLGEFFRAGRFYGRHCSLRGDPSTSEPKTRRIHQCTGGATMEETHIDCVNGAPTAQPFGVVNLTGLDPGIDMQLRRRDCDQAQ